MTREDPSQHLGILSMSTVNNLKESLVCQTCDPSSHNYDPCTLQSCPHAEVCYMPLFNIKGVDTKSHAYLKPINTHPEILHIVPSFKRAHTSLAQQHDLLGDEASGTCCLLYPITIFTT